MNLRAIASVVLVSFAASIASPAYADEPLVVPPGPETAIVGATIAASLDASEAPMSDPTVYAAAAAAEPEDDGPNTAKNILIAAAFILVAYAAYGHDPNR